MAKHCSNALALARFLESHRGVAKVHYPGLESHPQHARAAALFGSRFGGLLGVELADGVDCFDFLNRLRIVLMATHLGDTRSLALPAAHTIYYEMGAERRQQMIADSLIRVSVGIEDEATCCLTSIRRSTAACKDNFGHSRGRPVRPSRRVRASIAGIKVRPC